MRRSRESVSAKLDDRLLADRAAMCPTFNRGHQGSNPCASTGSPGLAAEDRTLNPGRLVRLQRRASALLVKRMITPRYERGDMGSSPVEGTRVRRSMGGPLACNQQIGVRLSADPLRRSSPEERPAYTRVEGGSIPSVAIWRLSRVSGLRACLKHRRIRFDSGGSHLEGRSANGQATRFSLS